MKKLSELKLEWLHREVDKLLADGKSKAEISRNLGVLPQYLNNILAGKRGVTDNFIDLFRNTFTINHFDLDTEPEPGTTDRPQETILHQIITDQRATIVTLSRENGRLRERLYQRSGVEIKE